jgi:hypothetical protein
MAELKITEVSLSFDVCKAPKLPVSNIVPFAIDTRACALRVQTPSPAFALEAKVQTEGGKEVERVVPAGTDVDNLPDWIMNCRPGYLRFTYASEPQSIECTFKESRSVLTFHGIKYRNIDALFNCDGFNKIFNVLDTEHYGEPVTMYKAMMVLNVGTPWDKNLVADIITNDPEISQVAAVSEAASTLCSRCLFSVSVEIPLRPPRRSEGYVRVTLRHGDQNESMAVVTMSRLPNTDVSAYVAGVVENIFKAYLRDYGNKLEVLHAVPPEPKGFSRLSGIRHLRNELPELFINNYTRECPVLPIMLSQEEAEALKPVQSVIFYPVSGPFGRFYTAPDGYFVGLKKNRLVNKDTFSCLVTCYLHDHLLRKGSETYMYYTGEEAMSRSKARPSRPIPRSMDNSLQSIGEKSGYNRRRTSSFFNAIEAATGRAMNAEPFPWCPQIVKQEMWNMSDADIMDAIRSGKCGPSTYRYFEELLNISIHVIVIKNGMFELFPTQEHDYIWGVPYPRHIVIFETVKKTYGETCLSYDFLVRDNNTTLFDSNDPVISSVLYQKSEKFVQPPEITDVAEQLIDEKGKCRMVVTSDGEWVVTLTRPFNAPVMPDPECFFDSHIHKMNEIKGSIGLPATDLYKRSTDKILYFPNDSSFHYWVNRVAK